MGGITYSAGIGKTFTECGDTEMSKEAMDALVAADPELAWTNPADAGPKECSPAENFQVSWRGAPAFRFSRIFIEWDDPNPEAAAKLCKVAEAIGATAFNELGDRIALKKGFFGGEKVVVVAD